MKKLIIILGCILLGSYIFNLLVGDSKTSFKSLEYKLMQEQVDGFNPVP